MDVCGVILAGGQSRRMGSRKELLDWGGKPLVLHLAENMRAAGLPCLIVSNEQEILPVAELQRLDVQFVADQGESFGPLSGIVAAFQAREEEAMLVLSCDLPFVDAEQIGKLAEQAKIWRDWDALVTESNGRLHPLLAVYHRNSSPFWRRALSRGDYRLMNTLEKLKLMRLP
ncbi:molybdenum cofactor guanylyltransferase, partial [Microbacteriaceae bacterium K1510]|nr:molybdenum cofactor guanylyltransferase [Microbacteriaceae bacterium K1510]